jgi:hypothetical protein
LRRVWPLIFASYCWQQPDVASAKPLIDSILSWSVALTNSLYRRASKTPLLQRNNSMPKPGNQRQIVGRHQHRYAHLIECLE